MGVNGSVAKTNIQISHETREKLREVGRMGETYDTLILRLIKELIELRKKK